MNVLQAYSLSIPSGAVELTHGLVHVVRVAVVEAATKSEAGVSGRPRIPRLCKFQERRYLSFKSFDAREGGAGDGGTREPRKA